MPIEKYYEIERLRTSVLEVLEKQPPKSDDGWLCRIALQFPDSLLKDAPEVCWKIENALSTADGKLPLVFTLGDTTFGSCCCDEVSALHLDADILIHFGHACLSPAMSLPIIYSFGVTEMDTSACVKTVVDAAKVASVQRILLLFQVQYYHAIEEIQTRLSEAGDILVIAGQIPQQGSSLMDDDDKEESHEEETKFVKVGGLEVPANLDMTTFTALFLGDPSHNRQYVNIMLRFGSASSNSPASVWTYNPNDNSLDTSMPSDIQRKLNRRFFLTQKARDATTFGILVGTLSQRHFSSAVSSLQKTIQDADRSCYTFAVGKINGAKLANFGEIDCYVLVACSETSLLDDERDLHVPVITPLELDIALGNVEWGDYSLDYNTFLELASNRTTGAAAGMSDDDDNDAPYFSLVSGKFEQVRKNAGAQQVNLSALPGKGQLTTYNSKGAEFLQKREFQGLETQIGQTDVHAALPGQSGIASNYSER